MINKKKIVLYGLGTVGKGFYHIYQDKKNPAFELTGIIVKNIHKHIHFPAHVPVYVYGTKDEQELFSQADIIIECTSHYEEGKNIVFSALKNGKTVISASKKVLAENLAMLIEAQKQYKGKLFYEAAAAASLPIFKILNQHFSHEDIRRFTGILNGTSNFILTKMETEGMSYSKALYQAQQSGYAEADPFLDVSGWDTAYKLVLLTFSASGIILNPHHLFIQGIDTLTFENIYFARNNGLRIKLLASADIAKGVFFVCPAFVADELALVDEAWNAIKIEYEYASTQFYTGKGAGKEATGSAIWGDLNLSQHPQKTDAKVPVIAQHISDDYGYWFIGLNTPDDHAHIRTHVQDVLTYNKIQKYCIVYASLTELKNIKQKLVGIQIIHISHQEILKKLTQQVASCSLQF